MATARFFLAIVLIALGAALIYVSCMPRPMAAVWVGSGVHASTVVFFAPMGYSTGFKQ